MYLTFHKGVERYKANMNKDVSWDPGELNLLAFPPEDPETGWAKLTYKLTLFLNCIVSRQGHWLHIYTLMKYRAVLKFGLLESSHVQGVKRRTPTEVHPIRCHHSIKALRSRQVIDQDPADPEVEILHRLS